MKVGSTSAESSKARDSSLPLAGLRILDCSTLLPGPFIGKLLAEQGAEVLKIENPDRPDPARAMGHFYETLNHQKKLIQLNLKSPAGKEKLEEWVQKSHGLIEGFRPEAKKKLGLTQENLHRINPRLNILSLMGFKENSPLQDIPAHDINFQARFGLLSLSGGQMPCLPWADLFVTYSGAFRFAAALANRSPQGQRLVVSLEEATLEAQTFLVQEYKKTGQPPQYGQTLFSGKYPCYRLYQTQDQRIVAVGAIEKKFWEKICDILKLPQLKDLGYAEGDDGQKVIQEIQAALDSKPWSHWEPLFEKANCCVDLERTYSDLFVTYA